MRFAFVKSTKSVGTQGLQDAHVNVSIVVAHKRVSIHFHVLPKRLEVVVEQLLPQLRWQIGLGIEQKRSNVILQRAFASALVIHKKGAPVAQQNVSRLEIAVKKIIPRSAEQKIRQAHEIIL